MALKFTDKLKRIDLGKAVDVASSITNSISHSIVKTKHSENSESEQIIDSIDSLGVYLQSLQPKSSPAIMMALQSQFQMLKYVQSPTMSLMVIDNIMLCLYKSLNAVEDNAIKESLKELFASLLQSFMFTTEARLRYEINSNKEEAVRLLADAGDLLISSVTTTATMVVPMATGVKMGHIIPKMVNVLASNTEQKSFLGRLIMAKGKKALIEEKKAEFSKTLNYIFETLDNYSNLVGPSIQLYGMLNRYADRLVEQYTISQYESVVKQINEGEVDKFETFITNSSQVEGVSKEKVGFKMLFKTFSQITKSPTSIDYESIRNIKRALQSELNGYDNQIEKLDNEIAALEIEIDQLSMLKFSRKSVLQDIIKQKQQQKGEIENKRLECYNKMNTVGDIIDPINEKIKQYEDYLQGVVKKYKLAI